MAWYVTGTISLTNGSTTVTGSGTSWVAGAGIGEALYAPDGRIYEIADIASNTSLTLASAYLGTTQSGQAYKIIPTQSYIRDLAADAASLISQYAGIASGAGAGKFTDGALATPGIAFASDVDTGLFRSATNTLQIVAGGTAALTATTSGVSVAGNTTLGDASTDTVQVNGYMGVGGAPSNSAGVLSSGAGLGGSVQTGFTSAITGNSAATARIRGFASGLGTVASAFTVTDLANFWASDASKGAGSTITNQHGVYIADQTQGTNNYGITSLVSSGTNKWNIYASGTANNYFAGNVGIGVTVPTSKFHVEHASLAIANFKLTSSANVGQVLISNDAGTGIHSLVYGSAYAGGSVFGVGANGTVIYSSATAPFAIGTYGVTQPLVLATNSTERLRIDSAGNVGIGTSSPAARLNIAGLGSTANSTWQGALLETNDLGGSTGNVGVYLSAPYATGTVNQAFFRVKRGAGSVYNGAEIAFNGSFRFLGSTTEDTSERMRIDSSGNVGIGLTPTARNNTRLQIVDGIGFPATQVASTDANTLDDYEEGTFTPTIIGTTTAGTGTYSTQIGRYTKIGNRVYFHISITWSAHTGTGNMKISGLPFTSSGDPSFIEIGASNLTYTDQITAYVESAASTIIIATFATGAALTQLPIDTAATVYVSGHYAV